MRTVSGSSAALSRRPDGRSSVRLSNRTVACFAVDRLDADIDLSSPDRSAAFVPRRIGWWEPNRLGEMFLEYKSELRVRRNSFVASARSLRSFWSAMRAMRESMPATENA